MEPEKPPVTEEDDEKFEDIQMFSKSTAKKKGKKSKKKPAPAPKAEEPDTSAEGDSDQSKAEDYPYEMLLERVTSLLKENNPALVKKTKYQIKVPNVQKLSVNKAVWINFEEICTSINRPMEHVMLFITTELSCEASFGQENQLILRWRYKNKIIEGLLIKYIQEYVTCWMCKNPRTTLNKEPATRLYFMHCTACHSTRSVSTIKSGFVAVKRGERKKVAQK